MKKLFTIDDFMIALMSSLGYGFGFTIPKLFGLPAVVCLLICLAFGFAVEELISKIVFSEAVQRRPRCLVLIYIAFFLIFAAANYVSFSWIGEHMLDYLLEEYVYIIGLPIIGFIVSLLIRRYRIKQIRKIYADGKEGYVFDVTNEDIEELNQINRPILGEYDADCAVKTRSGIYVGEKNKKTICYLGIPYAKPPVGELRWKAPEPLPSSDSVFEAKNFGASAIQVEHTGAILKHHRQSEDCLSLNICVGSGKTKSKKPVIVLFHHGDFTYGGSADPLLYGTNYVCKQPDIVLVSFNYRLGIFGFIDFSEIPGGEDYPDALNLGLLDQIAALKWIKENIAAFGGDPDQITVLGFESGATSIFLLAACEKAKGLFSRAVIFDGSPVSVYDTPENAKALANDLLKETHTKTMEELLQLETETLKGAAQRLWRDLCAPTCEGTYFPTDIYRAYQEGAASGIEFIIGITNSETKVFRSFVGGPNYENAIPAAADDIEKYMDYSLKIAVQEYIEAQTASSSALEARTKLIEQWLSLTIYRCAVRLAQGGDKVHLMYWDEKPLIENLGSGAVDVAAVLLGNTDALQLYGSVMNTDLSRTLQTLLQKFVSGNALRLYRNEIKGVDAFDWKEFPNALIVTDGNILCDTIEDKLTEIKGLFEFVTQKEYGI